MRFAVLGSLILAAGCSSSGDALVVVTVSSAQALTGLQSLHATATAAGHDKVFDVSPMGGAVFAIPPEVTFGIQIPSAYAGTFSLALDAVDGASHTLASGSNDTTTKAGKRSDLAVALVSGSNSDGGDDGGGSSDGGDGSVCVPMTCEQAGYGCGSFNSCGNSLDCGGCGVVAVEPAVAAAGDTVWLEGSFAPGTTVRFPGTMTDLVPDNLGAHRLSLIVPPGATAGPLGVSVAGAAGPLTAFFRRTTFDVAPSLFRQSYEQTEAGRPLPQLSIARSNGQAVSIGGAVVVIGGIDEGAPSPSPQPTVEVAAINADGTLGPLVLQGLPGDSNARVLSVGRVGFGAFAVGGALYVVGGSDNISAAFTSVEHAGISPDGSGISGFSVAPTTLTTGRFFFASAVIGDYYYVFGGATGGSFEAGTITATDTVERAPISAGGALGPFAPVSSRLTQQLIGGTALVINEKVYIFGGLSGGFLKTVQEAPIMRDGSIGAFTTSPMMMDTGRALAGVVYLGGTVYLIGGAAAAGGGAPTNTMESSVVIGGTPGNFAASAITTQRARTDQPVIVGNYIYYVTNDGGSGPGQSRSIERSCIYAGMGAAVADNGKPLTNPRRGMAAVIQGNNAYLFGGVDTMEVTTVVRASVDADGTLGAFSATGLPQLPAGRTGASAAVLGRNIYVWGGSIAGAVTNTGVQFAFNGDGTITIPGTPPNMVNARGNFSLIATQGYLYAIGGDKPPTVERLQLNPITGAFVGGWAMDASGTLPAGPGGKRMAALIGDTVYVVGGEAPSAEVDAAHPTATGMGAFAKQGFNLPNERYAGTLLTLGNLALVGGKGAVPDMMGAATDEFDVAPVSFDTNMMHFQLTGFLASPGVHLLIGRSSHVGLVAGNYAYFIGGDDSTGQHVASIEQFTLK